MELEKDNIDGLEVLPNGPGISEEDLKLANTAQSKKSSKPKKKDSSFLYGNEVADVLKSNNSSEQKLTMVCNKYSELLHANRKLMMAYKMSEGKIGKLQQENEQCQQQRSKAVLARSRLENLCRELQKLNKAQKEEIDLKLRLEEEKRKEISAKFQSAFAEINTLTNQNTEKNSKIREENLEMREKIKSVRDRIELSEQQLEKVRQQAQLELQLAEAKMATVKMEMTAEKECLLKEKQQLLMKLTEYQVRIGELQAVEVGLRSQISMYTEKYDDFQSALTKSNEVFSNFNEEMEKMSKKILKLEKETVLWKQRWENSHTALLEMAAEKQTRDAEMVKLNHKLSLLQELCKAFQRERAELLAQLRATNGHAPTGIDHSKMDNVDIKQVDELSKDCQQLKDDLAHLQGSLAEVIETADEQVSEELPKTLEPTETTPSNASNAEINIESPAPLPEAINVIVAAAEITESIDKVDEATSCLEGTNENPTQDLAPDQLVKTIAEENKNSLDCVDGINGDEHLEESLMIEEPVRNINEIDGIIKTTECESTVYDAQSADKNNLDILEDKKEGNVKQNNSGSTKKSSGKRKKK